MDADAGLRDLHDRFCRGFAEREPSLVLGAVAEIPELVVVTSEDAVVRGIDEMRSFLERYAEGPTTYAWTWERRHTFASEDLGCLLALGVEEATHTTGSGAIQTPYRMTVVARPGEPGWEAVQVHGSSPHLSPAEAAR